MADAALYIYKKLKEDHLLTKAFNWDPDRGTQDFEIVCVGHSLGAGTATILAIMLKQEFPNTKCYAFSPPGGLIRYYTFKISFNFNQLMEGTIMLGHPVNELGQYINNLK